MTIESSTSQPLPTLTVVIPHYNHGHLIGDQLSAIFSQSIRPTKIIIIDDASTDDSVSIIQRLIVGQPNVEFIRKTTNSGGVHLFNEFLNFVSTDYVTSLAADDIILPGFFEKSLALLARYPKAALCSAISIAQYKSREWVIPNRSAYPRSSPGYLAPERVGEMLLKIESWYMGNTAVFRVDSLREIGGFDIELSSYADDFAYRVLALRYGACFIPECLAINRQQHTSYSASTTRDDALFEQILIISNARMRTAFPDLFPPDLIARSNSRMLYRFLCSTLNNFTERAVKVIGDMRVAHGKSIVLLLVRWAPKALSLLLFCVLRFRDIPRVVLSRLWPKHPALIETVRAQENSTQ